MPSHGAATRRPVYTGSRRIPGLYSRELTDGSTVYDAALRLGGKVRRRRLTARTKSDAIAELRALQVDAARGEEYRSSSAALSVEDLLETFVEHLRTRIGDPDAKRRRSARTVEHYRYQLARHVLPVVGQLPASDLTAAHVRRVLDAMAAKRLSPSSRTGVLTAVSSMLRFAVKAGIVERNVVRDLDRDDRPGTARLTEPRYLSIDQLDALLSTMGDTFRPVAAACAFAGLRVSEALALHWNDVDMQAGTIAVTAQLGTDGELVPLKTLASAASDVPLLPALAAELRAHRQRVASQSLARVHGEALMFSTKTGRPQIARNVLRAIHAAGDAAGLNGRVERTEDGRVIREREPVGVHDLRHSYIAVALQSGQVTLPEAAVLARHANAKITAAAYGGITEDARAKLAGKLAAAFGAPI